MTTFNDSPTVVVQDSESSDDDVKKSAWYFCFHKTRFVILLVSLCCLTAAQANPLLLNFTIISMQDVIQHGNSSKKIKKEN